MSTSQSENAAGQQAPVLDPVQLALLMEMGDEGDSSTIKEIAVQFVEDISAVMARLEAATGAGDFSQVAKAAHTIKGSAATFGLHQLENIARQLEASAKDAAKHESVPAICESLRGAFATGRGALEAYFAAR
jgi:HPt (histidine-containing phosphotransfer) domain-containing protein